ncbi:AVAST type 1 anti-phage system MBL fold metallo-hydrolase Avs1a [Pseudomonas iridis]|uniref:AVAST type 1 anti-phage system MBL fold metallo-hydrolase Avs1a n=1 Tax=Pseudomonas TaxID=286 RepID=UPI0028EDE1C9|nr:AVAST type 1 anti-phage system MBL fold metallo-hydrolase Avs1a [Pseudomonas grimontii]
MLRVKMYPARNGDAFLIDASGTYILVDAGFASTYSNHVAQDLAQLSNLGGRLSLVVCTHIDADHIGGLLEFFSTNGSLATRAIGVDAVWHNSLRSLPESTDVPDSIQDLMVLEAVRRRGFPKAPDRSASQITALQGSSLARLLREHGYAWNAGDGTSSIDNKTSPLNLPNGVQIQVIGPMFARLEALRSLWFREMRKLGLRGGALSSDLVDDAYEMWCSAAPQPSFPTATPIAAKFDRRLSEVYVADKSISNGSSIAFVLSTGRSRVLFLGDAWAEDIVAALKPLQTTASPLLFDAIKVSHHGSLHNTSEALLSVIDSPCFLISSDGTHHGHPDFEVLAEIVDRPASFERKLYFNYATTASKRLQEHISRSGARFSVHIDDQHWIQMKGSDS